MEALKKYEAELTKLKNDIWGFAELNYKEFKSVTVQKKMMEAHGFRITDCLAGLPTSFMAEYGSGSPVIALLGEYDALPKLSQKAVPDPDPVEEGGNGHGCGHCLSAPGAIGAALVVKDAIDAGEVQGTVRYYACPAEEGGFGKGFMVQEHVFDGADAAFFWHPEPITQVCNHSVRSLYPIDFHFHREETRDVAHPQMVRSALDAVELLNISANYLREHLPEDARLTYRITNGGAPSLIQPDEATVSYRVRAVSRESLEHTVERLLECAQGAALMTRSTCDVKYSPSADAMIKNFVLNDLLWEKMQEAGAPDFDEVDEAFAKQSITHYMASYAVGAKVIKERSGVDVAGRALSRELLPVDNARETTYVNGATDLGDISQVVPTAEFNVASAPIGSRPHSISNTGSFGTPIGTKGTLKAAEIMALSALELMSNPEMLKAAKDEFDARTKGNPNPPLMHKDVKPPIFQQEEVYPEGLGL